MAVDRTPADFRALVPSAPLVLDASVSTYVEQSPRVGVARVASGTRSAGVLVASGEQSAAGNQEIQIRRPGFAGREAAGMVWRNKNDARWRGWDQPTMITGWQSVIWLDGSDAAQVGTANPHALTLASGVVLIAYAEWGTLPAEYRVMTVARSADGATIGTPVEVYGQTADLTRGFHPCLLQLPSGRVLLFHGLELDATTYQVQIWSSDDDGATWGLYSTRALDTFINYGTRVPGRLRAAYLNGQILLIVQTRDIDTAQGVTTSVDSLWQWASSDLGGTFTAIQADPSVARDEAGSMPDLVVVDGHFILGWARYVTGDTYDPVIVSLPDAYTDYTSQTAETGSMRSVGPSTQAAASSWQLTSGDLSLIVDDAGVVWLITINGEDGGPDYDGIMAVSFTGGSGLSNVITDGSVFRKWWNSEDVATYPRGFAGCFWRGTVLLASGWAANPGDEGNSIALIRLGGWSTVTYPYYAAYRGRRIVPGWSRTWLPFDEPGDVGWTVAGAGSETLADGALTVTTAGAIRSYVLTGWLGSIAEGLMVGFFVAPVSGGSLSSDDIAVRLRIDGGAATESYDVSIRFTTTGFRVYDNEGAATLGSDVAKTLTGGVHVLAHLSSAGIFVAYSLHGQDSDRAYVVSHDEATLDGGGSAAIRSVRWGHIASATAESDWTFFAVATDDNVGEGLAGGQTSPDDQRHGPLSSEPVYTDDGVRVRGELGPFFIGEEFFIQAGADWPASAAMYRDVPSAVRQFRSAVGAPPSQQILTWRLVEDYTTPGLQDGSLCLILTGCNWRTATLARESSAGAWSTLASIDLATGQTSIPFVRKGNTVYLDTGGSFTGPWYVHRNALVGATVDLGGGDLRLVTSNTDGVWTTSGTVRRPILTLAGIDDTEATSGNMNIWMPQAAIVVHAASTVAEAAGYRLTVTSQATAAQDLRLKAHLGPLVPFAVHPDAGRAVTRQALYEEVRHQDGSRHRTRTGTPRRIITLSWAEDGLSTHHVGGSSPGPDYAMGTTAANARPAASRGAEPLTMSGLIDDLDGQRLPVGWLGYVPVGSASPGVHHILRPDLFLVGLLDGEIRYEERSGSNRAAGGQEWSGALTSIAQVSIEEIR